MILQHASFIGPDHRLHHKDIRIVGSIITEIEDHLPPSLGEDRMDCSGLLVIPALADCHVHSPDTILKGLFSGVPMSAWCDESPLGKLQSRLFDYLDGCVDTPEFKSLVRYSYLQYLHNGVGFIVETGQADDSHQILQSCADEIGIKAVIDWYDQVPRKPPSGNRLATGIHLPEEEDLTEESLREIVGLRRNYPGIPLMTHCLENRWRLEEVFRKFGTSTVQLMKTHHILDVHTLLFHSIQVSDEDIATIANHCATVVCCPVSSMRIGEGFMPVAKMLGQKVNVTLGTDFLDHDIWDCMRFLYTELNSCVPQVTNPAQQVWDMASRNAAAIAHMVGYQGTIEVGSSADLCFLHHTHHLDPLIEDETFSNILHNVLNTGHASLVRHMMIAGSFVLKDGFCTTIDENGVNREYQTILVEQFGRRNHWNHRE